MNVFPPADVFIDSNLVIKNCYDFHSGDLERLRHYSELGIIRLLTSEIVVNEVVENIKQEVNLYASNLRNFISKRKPINELKLLDDKHRFLFEDFRKLGWQEYIISRWHEYIEATGCHIIPYSTVPIQSVVSDYFNNIPPFETAKLKKSEFPDSIIIKSLIEYAKDSLVTTFILTDDKGWLNAFPDEGIMLWGESSKRYIVVDNVNTILKCIYKIESEETEYANIVLSDISSINSAIEILVKLNIEDMSAFVEFNDSYIIDLSEDYDEIEEIIVDKITPTFSSFEEIDGNHVSTIFDLELDLRITFSVTDYDNSIYDSEDKVYLFIKHRNVTQLHSCDTSIRVELSKQDDKHYYVSSIKYPYKIEVSDETYIYEVENDDDDEVDDDFDLYEADDDSLTVSLYEPDDDSLNVNLNEADDDSLNINLYESDESEK